MKPIYERWIYILISLLVAICICLYNFELIPDFDIGLNAGFITLSCIGVTFAFFVIEVILLWHLTPGTGSHSKACWFTIAIYWFIVWGWCFWKCVLEANQLANEMLYGDI